MSVVPNCPLILPLLMNKLFLRLESSFAQNNQAEFSPDDLLELYGIFGELLHPALDLIDHKRIKLYTPPNRRRRIVEIQAAHSTGITYKFFPHINYCPCKAFKEYVLRGDAVYTCRHVLGTKLAIISGKQTEEVVADDLFNFLIETIGDQ